MDVTAVIFWATTSLLVSNVGADLPSCDRARCHHCRVTFIAKMCPETCEPCPKEKYLLDHEVQTKRTLSQAAKDPRQLQNNFSRKPGPSASPFGGFIRTTIVNGSPNDFHRSQRPQAQAVNTQQLSPHLLPQKPPYAVQYNAIPAQSLPDLHPYQQLYSQPQPQQQVAQLTAPPQQQFPGIGPLPSPPQQFEQTPLPVTPFPSFPTFTFPTLPPFTFPTVTFAPPIYRPTIPRVPQNQAAAQTPPPQTFLPAAAAQGQHNYVAQIFPSAQALVPPAAGSSQLQTYSHQHQQQQPPAQHYTAVQQAVPTFPVIRTPELPAQQVQPQQRQPTYSQQLQQQQHHQQQQPYYATNQQIAVVPIGPQPQTQLAQKAEGPTAVLVVPQALPPVTYNIDGLSSNYIDKTYYETGEEHSAIAQCPRQPNWEPCISKEEANDRFKTCCKALGQGCAALCNYDATLTTIQLAVLTGRCPLSKVGDVMICASGHVNATPCCEAYNVFEPGYEHCRPYCNPSAGLPQGGMLSEQYKCLGKLSQIQRCFYVSQRP